MQDSARDWLLSHTLCDRTPSTHCEGELGDEDATTPPGDPPDGGNGMGGGSPGDGDSTGGGDPEPEVPDGDMAGAVATDAGGCSCSQAGKKRGVPPLGLVCFSGLLMGHAVGRRRAHLP